MKFIDSLLLVLLVAMWLTVSMHILKVWELDSSSQYIFFRMDLALVPICISVTIYIFWNIFKQNRK